MSDKVICDKCGKELKKDPKVLVDHIIYDHNDKEVEAQLMLNAAVMGTNINEIHKHLRIKEVKNKDE